MPLIDLADCYQLNESGAQVDKVTGLPYKNESLTADEKAQFLKGIAGVVKVSFSSFSSLPQTVSDTDVTATQEVVHAVLSNPAAQTGDWTVTTAAGSVTVSGTINGSTTLTLYLAEPV